MAALADQRLRRSRASVLKQSLTSDLRPLTPDPSTTMSERERWIVYPLLFLALGAALRDKLFNITTSKSIVCQELTVIDEEPVGLRPARVLAKIGRTDGVPASSPPVGYLFVDGQVEVNGAVVARQYGMRGLPYAPGILGILPPEVWRAFQQSAQALQDAKPSDANPPDAQPPSGEPIEEKVPATESKSGGGASSDQPPQ